MVYFILKTYNYLSYSVRTYVNRCYEIPILKSVKLILQRHFHYLVLLKIL